MKSSYMSSYMIHHDSFDTYRMYIFIYYIFIKCDSLFDENVDYLLMQVEMWGVLHTCVCVCVRAHDEC